MMPDRHWRQIIPDLVQERVNTQVVIRQAAVFADTVFCRLLGGHVLSHLHPGCGRNRTSSSSTTTTNAQAEIKFILCTRRFSV
jgi:hypothetical protein